MLVKFSPAIKNWSARLLALLALLPFNIAKAYDFNVNSGLNTTANKSGYTNTALNNAGAIDTSIANIISIVLSFIGVIFLILIILAGLRWMLAGGNEEEATKSKHSIRDAAIGLIIVFGAYAIVWLVVSLTSGKTLMSGQ